jgi:hypothetical protein
MRPWLPIYEGDGYLRQTDLSLVIPVRKDGTPGVLEGLSPRLIERRAQELRHAAMRSMLVSLLQRARDWLGDAPAAEAERYLAQATDLADLERRLVDAERRGLLCGRI